jgi:hypothetical protein
MRKLLTLAALGALIAGPALADSMTFEFAAEGEDGVLVATFVDDGTYKASDDSAGTYVWDLETATLCATSDAGEETCVTFEDISQQPVVGLTTPFTATNGAKGIATITAMVP